jgi:two-component system, NtrC family, sensor histidine kinase AtoS
MANPPTRIGLWWTRTNDPGDFDSLLNLVPDPSLLVDRKNNTISTTNSALLKLCAFTQTELKGKPIRDLIRDMPDSPVEIGNEYSVTVNRRMREAISVRMKVTANLTEGQQVISLFPDDTGSNLPINENPTLFDDIFELTKISDETDLGKALDRVIEVTHQLTGCDFICIYQADPTYPRLQKTSQTASGTVFPDALPSTDLIRLASPSLWRPGKRVVTEIHRTGKVGNMVYVASAPLGHGNALCGLILAADNVKQPRENLLQSLTFIGNMVAGIIQKNALLINMSKELSDLRDQILIRNGLYENSHEGIIELDKELHIVTINTTIEEILGYASDEIVGMPAENVLIGADSLSMAFQHASQGLATHNLGTVSLHHRDGHLTPVTIRVVPILKDGTVSSVLVMIEDVTATEQIRLRTQQLEHRAVLGEFTAIFAHEVRNPINNISTGLQVLSSRMDASDPNQDVINRMLNDCSRLDHLMESVLSFSRPMENTFHPVELGQLLQRLLDRWHPRFARVNVNLSFQPNEDLPKILGDHRSLEQVFTNLISNAVEAMSKTGGTLTIRLQPSDLIPNRPQVEIIVSDDGPGIPDEIRDRIFDPFVTNRSKGTGLGLAITKRIVTAHQGTITVNSFPGGTVFHVYLPVATGA